MVVERCIRRFVIGIVLGLAASVCIPCAGNARPADRRQNPPGSASFQIWHYKVNRTVLEEPWVLLIRGKNVALYNLADDTDQMEDRSGERPDVVARLKRHLLEWEQKLAVDNGHWKRHTIDDSSRGADGVRLGDANGDGLMDITTAWEEGGVVRVYINPGPKRACDLWPAVTVGEVKRPEDAVFADLDGDGAMDVVSSCEGRTRTVYVHWAPKEPSKYLNPAAWRTDAFAATAGRQMWMFALPLQIDGRGGIDVVVGSKAEKGQRGEIGWLQSPPQGDPRRVEAWKYHFLHAVGWTMSLEPDDLDGDGDIDVVVSDQAGAGRGIFWLENPGADASWAGAPWTAHRILAARAGVNFLTVTDLERDGKSDILCAGAPPALSWLRRRPGAGDNKEGVAAGWEMRRIRTPEGLGCKAVRVADLNLDDKPDIVTTLGGGGDRPSVYWMSYRQSVTEEEWLTHEISGPFGQKFDLIQLLDLDHDGDLDVITCEEDYNLGVFWYENPTR
ncbi:MAG TPA: VCBS repeat-containing protein [Sedimentisphaerales bacterium]|nr:VCBS repeat-containing protein [Sedimentisphaerales bacterium]